MTQPNILFYFVDQQRADTCGCYGQPLDVTPNLDAMAAEGVRFENAFSCQPVCGPARACIQTGTWATQNGCYRNGIALPLDTDTIARQLSGSGYEVGYIGKWHLASTNGKGEADVDHRVKPVPPEYRGGYDDFWLASDVLEFTSHGYDGHMFDGDGNRREFPEGRYRADAQTDWVLEYLDSREGEKPFFLFVSYIEPHHQNDHNCYEGPHGSRERFKDFVTPGDLVGTEGNWAKEYPDYLGCCASLDENLGRVRAKLDERGLADNTLIIYVSDHGSHFCTRNGEYKRSCHDSSIRIPLVINGPGFKGGKVVNDIASLIDTPATILKAAGVEVPQSYVGRALQDVVESCPADWRQEAFIQISESQVGRAIRTPRWTYSVAAPDRHGNRDAAAEVYVEEYLYDLKSDPHQRNNRVADPEYASIRSELAARLTARMVTAGEATPRIDPAP
jgi:arylsulfatase A-like enzyme